MNSRSRIHKSRDLSIAAVVGTVVALYYLLGAWTLSDPFDVGVFLLIALCWCVVALVPRATTLGVSVIATVGLLSYFKLARRAEENAFRPLANAARRVVHTARPFDPAGVLAGKALVWDVARDRLSPAYHRLPAPFRARPDDQAMTIYLIEDSRSKKVGQYVNQTDPSPERTSVGEGFRDTVDVAAVAWPEGRIIAWHVIVGAGPPATINGPWGREVGSVHGDVSEPIADWIRSIQEPPVLHALDPAFVFSAFMHPVSGPEPMVWTEAAARAEAVRRYPQLGIVGSPMNRSFLERYERMKADRPERLRDPAWPLKLAEEVAK